MCLIDENCVNRTLTKISHPNGGSFTVRLLRSETRDILAQNEYDNLSLEFLREGISRHVHSLSFEAIAFTYTLHVQSSRIVLWINEFHCMTNDSSRKKVQVTTRQDTKPISEFKDRNDQWNGVIFLPVRVLEIPLEIQRRVDNCH